jgi:hypothetical protein
VAAFSLSGDRSTTRLSDKRISGTFRAVGRSWLIEPATDTTTAAGR